MHLETVNYHYDPTRREPKYLQLANALELWLTLSAFKRGEKFPSDRQLAEFFHMGTLTVSRSVNELVDRGLLERRVGAGTYLTERQSPSKWPKSRRMGLVCHEVMREDGSFVTEVRRTLQAAAEAKHIDLVSLTRSPDQYESTIRDYNLGAMMVLAPQKQFLPELQRLHSDGFPLATLGAFLSEISEFSFGTAHAETAASAVNYLTEQGCHRLGIVLRSNRGMEPDISVHERENGFLEGMWRNRQLVNPHLIFRKFSGEDDGFNRSLQRMMVDSEQAPDGLLITSLSDALVIYALMRECGKRIPEDLALVGFDEADYTTLLTPALTVWRQNTATSAEQAFAYLYRRMNGQSVEPHQATAATLVERGSSMKNGKES